MRLLASTVFLALLAACTVTTTGAPCSSDMNCPSDQGCGNDGKCGPEALACPGHTTAGECIPGTSCLGGELVTCTAAGGVCSTGPVPAANTCTQLDATQCSATGEQVLRCKPFVTGSACLSWQAETGCAASSLLCIAGACVCPANSGPEYVADAVNGSAGGSPPNPTGLASPLACRYRTITDALTAANGHGSGSTVRAAGWSASLPGGVVLFSEPGALSIGAVVTLTTDDAVPAIGHYAITTAAALTGAFVTMAPGSSVSGFELRNEASTGAGVLTDCPTASDIGPGTLSTVRIAAASSGTPIVRFASGVHLTGYCPVSMTGVTIADAVTGILAEAEAPTTMTGGAVTGNGTGVSIGAAGAAAPSFSATGTAFRSNTGDAVYVARGGLFSDACPFETNGTHVHAQPVGGAAVSVTVQNSSGIAKMTGATNSAFRLLAMGSGSVLSLLNNAITGNDATQSYNVVSGLRRGGGVVLTAPLPGTASCRGNSFFGNKWDQVLVAAGIGALDFSGTISCGVDANSFACFDAANPSVGLYSNGATVVADWNHWTVQPGVFGTDVGGIGVTGFETRACPPATITCP